MKAIGRIVLILALMALLFVMVRCTTLAERQAEPAGSPPVVTHSFAVEKLSHGDTWKIYLEAEDPDGDMRTIKYSIGKGGYIHSFKSFVIKKGNRARLLGYLDGFLSSPTTAVAEWTELTLTLYIRDKRGNTSDKVVFPLALTRGVKQGPPPPPFDKGGLKGLGVFWVKLYAPVE
jgi:hypothetical protein